MGPETSYQLSWDTYHQVTGAYSYYGSSGDGLFNCNGCEIVPQAYGIDCSAGGGNSFKVLPAYAKNPVVNTWDGRATPQEVISIAKSIVDKSVECVGFCSDGSHLDDASNKESANNICNFYNWIGYECSCASTSAINGIFDDNSNKPIGSGDKYTLKCLNIIELL